MPMFKNREEAGRKLAKQLNNLTIEQSNNSIVVMAIPRGGVVVGKVLADKLGCPLGVLVVKKIGAPGNPELAIGAMGPDGETIWNLGILGDLGVSKEEMEREIEELRKEVIEKIKKYKIKNLDLKDKTVILTDDGIATGATMEAAIRYVHGKQPKKIVMALPVAPPETVEKFRNLVDELIVLETPEYFSAVGQFYEEFPQISDEEVVKLLE